MIRVLIVVICILAPLRSFAADHGIAMRESPYSVQQTLDRLVTVLEGRGIRVFVRIDHAEEAKKAGLDLRPTQLLIFGNPRSGTPLMVAHPTIAIDLPMKALAWQDAEGKVWIGFNSADYLKGRHDLTEEQAKSIAATGVLIDAALK